MAMNCPKCGSEMILLLDYTCDTCNPPKVNAHKEVTHEHESAKVYDSVEVMSVNFYVDPTFSIDNTRKYQIQRSDDGGNSRRWVFDEIDIKRMINFIMLRGPESTANIAGVRFYFTHNHRLIIQSRPSDINKDDGWSFTHKDDQIEIIDFFRKHI